MITRDEAAAIADRLREPWTSHRGEMAHVLRVDADRFRDLALTVVALHDEVARLTRALADNEERHENELVELVNQWSP